MTSEAKIAADRRNAQRSTGPRTAPAKARVRRNALRHGLAALIVGEFGASSEIDRVADAICRPNGDSSDREQALIVAEAQVTLRRVRRTRTQIMDQMSPAPATKNPDAKSGARTAAVTHSRACLDQLLRLERYERRALARRKRAARLLSSP